MGFRVDDVRVEIDINVESDMGGKTIRFAFAPEKKFGHDLDPLVRALLDKNVEILNAAMIAAGPITDPGVGIL